LCVVTTHLAAATDILRLFRASGCLSTSRGTSHGTLSTTSPTPRVRVPWHLVQLVTRLIVDYFEYATRSGASAPRAARRVARRAAPRRLLRLRHASGCLGTSRGSSLTTSLAPRVRVPRHLARLVTPLVVDYFDYVTRPGASACHAACC
jgi:hypothetical protein